MSDEKLPFKTYRAHKRPFGRLRKSGTPGLDEIDRQSRGKRAVAPPPESARQSGRREPSPPPDQQRPQMRTYRSAGAEQSPRRPVPPGGGALAGAGSAAGGVARGAGRTARRIGLRRAIKWFFIWAVSWVILSGALFAVSATIESGKIDDNANEVLGGGGNMLTSPANVLVLGIDRRPPGKREPGAEGASSRSDSMMLMRVGGGEAARLSILRDSYAEIPGYQAQKINAAFALGGTALAVQSVERFLPGVEVNHVIIVDFENFPGLIDALGGVDVRVRGRCVRSDFGGVHFALPRGEHHLSGAQALRYARVRKNACDPSEDDRDRARRQQQVLSAMKSQTFSPWGFVRMPWIAWQAPKAIVTDMSPVSLAAFMTSMTIGPEAKTKVLEPSGAGPAGSLLISEQERAAAARRFLND